MNLDTERSFEEDLADRLWRAIHMLQAITDRLLTQYEKSLRDQGDSYSLASLPTI